MKRSIAVAHFVQGKRRASEPVAFIGSGLAHRGWSSYRKSEALRTAQAPRSAESCRSIAEQPDWLRCVPHEHNTLPPLTGSSEAVGITQCRKSGWLGAHHYSTQQLINSLDNTNDPSCERCDPQGARRSLYRSGVSMNHDATRSGERSRFTILVIDIGGTNIKFGYVQEGRPQSFTHLVPTQRLRNPAPVISLADETRQAIALCGVVPDIVVCTVPGFLAKDGDLVLHLTNIPEMDGYRLRTDLSAQLALPVMLERDSNLALLGESIAGVAKDADSVLGVFFGTGIGASLIVSGKPFRGNGWALELGHAPVFGEHTELAGLKHPSFEDYASGRALQAIAIRHGVPIADVFLKAPAHASLASDLDRFVRYQALAVAAAMAVLSPATVVLGGGVLDVESYPKQRLKELIAANSPFSKTDLALDLRWAALGWISALHGAPQIVGERASWIDA